MNIPCDTCQRRSECQRDRRCNRPLTVAAAGREMKEAADALAAAARRMNEAITRFQAVVAIEKGKLP